MKKEIIFFVLIGVIFSCNGNDDSMETKLIGKWNLIEVLADPGDGSGTFQSVNSKRTIEFNNNGTVKSNGEICNFSIESNTPSSGTYSVSDSSISADCNFQYFNIRFEHKGSTLIISYPCFEGCQVKYVKK